MLCASQRRLSQQLCAIAHDTVSEPPSALIVGPRGSGKRQIAKAVARELAMEFVECPLAHSAEAVARELFGCESQLTEEIGQREAPGLCGRSGPVLLYLSGIQASSDDLWRELYRLAQSRSYDDGDGQTWRLAGQVWIVASLTYPSDSQNITPEHWMCSAFEHRFHLRRPDAPAEFKELSTSWMASRGYKHELSDDGAEELRVLTQSQEGLHLALRCLERAASSVSPGDEIHAQHIRGAAVSELDYQYERLLYRGRQLQSRHLQPWLEQFPEELRGVAIVITRQIVERYYIGDDRCYSALEAMIQQSGIPLGSRVLIARWQHMGQSAPRIGHALKNQARWRVAGEIDFNDPTASFGRLHGGVPGWLVVADDFVGSGDTLSSALIGVMARGLADLLMQNPGLQLRIVVLAGFRMGIRKIRETVKAFRDQVRICVPILFDEADRCFSSCSRIIPEPDSRKRFEGFCLETARRHFKGLRAADYLGWQGTGGLVVFPDTVPNNTLPILWYDNSPSWRPLFPGSGLPD
ncbi:MAG: sigma 54-interacting transcriptional regulator [Armatimonadetes bacterium]|nr:sigma 54-interacting transcriptional regulator [Armatimonadota bacterium]